MVSSLFLIQTLFKFLDQFFHYLEFAKNFATLSVFRGERTFLSPVSIHCRDKLMEIFCFR